MISHESIATIEKLLSDNTPSSLTYAALECRLAIEQICYERLALAHDYISHDDIKRWQPRDIVNFLIKEVDSKAASTFTVSISKDPILEGSSEPTLEEYQAMDFIPIGTQVGFDPAKIGRLWNGLAHLALHISIPTSKDSVVHRYGDSSKIREKVIESLEEIKRIDSGTMLASCVGEEVSFDCLCGTKNRRRLSLLSSKSIVSCINPKCDESFEYDDIGRLFNRRMIEIACANCGNKLCIPKKIVEKLRTDQHGRLDCERCGQRVFVQWKLMQVQAPGQQT